MRCPRCTGTMVRDLDGASCLNCSFSHGRAAALVIVAALDTRTCAGCAIVFAVESVPRGNDRRYCDDNCRKRASKRRVRAVA